MSERRDIKVMIEEIHMIPDMIKSGIQLYKNSVDECKDALTARKFSRVYCVGCGDSYYAGLAMRSYFIQQSGIPFECVEALEFCRYEIDYMPEDALVCVVSYSGSVARTIECAVAARKRGATVLAITGNPDCRLARECDNKIVFHIDSLGFAPGTLSYASTCLMLAVLGVKVGSYAGYLNAEEENEAYSDLAKLSDVIADSTKNNEESIRKAAEAVKNRSKFYCIGAGPNKATALFSAAKFLEGSEIDGIPQDLEEWAHEQYFVSSPVTDTLVIAPSGRSVGRAEELVREMNFIGTGNILFGDQAGGALGAETAFLISDTVSEALSPLPLSVMVSIFAYYHSFANQKSSYNFKSEEFEKEHYETLHNSIFLE